MRDGAVSTRKTILILRIAVIILAAVIAALLISDVGSFRQKMNIEYVETLTQDANSITYTNYVVVVKEEFGWDTAADANREKMAEYAVKSAIKTAEKSGVRDYNVIGVIGKERTPIFSYMKGETIKLYLNGKKSGEIER